MISLSVAIQGPSLLLDLPNKIWLIFVGTFLTGFFAAFLFVPVTPEIMDAVSTDLCNSYKESIAKQGLSECEIEDSVDDYSNQIRGSLADKGAAAFNFSYSVGAMIGPVLGGVLCDNFGYRQTFDIVSLICILFAIAYFCTVIIPKFCCYCRKGTR